jgi:hypothetical protein
MPERGGVAGDILEDGVDALGLAIAADLLEFAGHAHA